MSDRAARVEIVGWAAGQRPKAADGLAVTQFAKGLEHPRWLLALPNGDVLVVSGEIDLTVGVNPLPEVFQAASGTWRDLTGAQLKLDLYPWMHLAPNGKIFNSINEATRAAMPSTRAEESL